MTDTRKGRLGKHQLCMLATMASPFNLLIVGDKLCASLVNRGLLAPHFSGKDRDGESFFGITPNGLRTVADALERGDLDQFLDDKFQRDRVRLYMNARKAQP